MEECHRENWLSFWKSREITKERDKVWQMNMDFFARSSESIMNYNKSDSVLDIGCGAGYLSSFLHMDVKEIHGVDIAENYIEICKNKFTEMNNVHFYKLNEDNYTNLDILNDKKFSTIICLSVIQYYKNQDDVVKLIKSVQNVIDKDGLFLIADIPCGEDAVSDIWSTLYLGWRYGILLSTLKYLLKMRISEYHDIKSHIGLQYYPEYFLDSFQNELGFSYTVIRDQLTINRSRFHWLIKFN